MKYNIIMYDTYGIQTIAPEENCPPVKVRVWVSFRVGGSLGTIFLESIHINMICVTMIIISSII